MQVILEMISQLVTYIQTEGHRGHLKIENLKNNFLLFHGVGT